MRRLDETDPHGHITTTIREWKRRDWGEGGLEFHWWCTDTTGGSEAFTGRAPVWVTSRDELIEMCGEPIYDQLVAILRKRSEGRSADLASGRPAEVNSRGKSVAITAKRGAGAAAIGGPKR